MLAIYCRISRDKEEGKDRSINDQKLLGIDLAKRLKIPYKVYIDEGISGTLPIEKRPEFSKLLDDIENNVITHLYAYDQSRLERSPQTRIVLNHLLKKNEVRLFTEGEEIDLKNDEAEMLGDIMSAFNSYFVRQTKKKIKSVLLRNVKDGKAHSSILPYGYKKDADGFLAIEESEAEIIKRIYFLSFEGKGTNKIAEIFNNDGILTRYNKIAKGTITTTNKYTNVKTTTNKKDIRWSGNTIRNIIVNTIYKGERKYNNEFYKAPVIIEPIYWQKVNDNLKNNRNNSGKTVEHKYLLKGLLLCAKCGRNYYGRTRVNKKDNYYMCSSKRYKLLNCGNRSFNIDVLEYFIWDRFFKSNELLNVVRNHYEKSNNNDIIDKLKSDVASLTKKLESIKRDKDRAIDLAIEGYLTKAELEPKIASLKVKISDIEVNIRHINSEIDNYNNSKSKIDDIAKDLRNLKSDTSFNIKRDLINKYIDFISIAYLENGFFSLAIKFDIINLTTEFYMINRNYDFAYEPFKQIFIGLSERYKNMNLLQDYKNQLTYSFSEYIPKTLDLKKFD